MHTYQPQWPPDDPNWRPPSPADLQFRDARDVASYASLNSLTTWYTHPLVWHLVALRRGLARHGVTLLDVVVFDDDFHWWSLHELTSGSTKWNFRPEPRSSLWEESATDWT